MGAVVRRLHRRHGPRTRTRFPRRPLRLGGGGGGRPGCSGSRGGGEGRPGSGGSGASVRGRRRHGRPTYGGPVTAARTLGATARAPHGPGDLPGRGETAGAGADAPRPTDGPPATPGASLPAGPRGSRFHHGGRPAQGPHGRARARRNRIPRPGRSAARTTTPRRPSAHATTARGSSAHATTARGSSARPTRTRLRAPRCLCGAPWLRRLAAAHLRRRTHGTSARRSR